DKKLDDQKIDEILCRILLHFKLMEDRDFLYFLEIMINLSPIAKKLFNRLISRTLYKGFGYYPSPNFQEIGYPESVTNIIKNEYLRLYLPTNFWDYLIKDKNLSKYSLEYWEKGS
ncbi:unnamed protein product, partial [marine sediment metagenome]